MSALFGSPEHRSAVQDAVDAALARCLLAPPAAVAALHLASAWATGERPGADENTDQLLSLLRQRIDEADSLGCEVAADAADLVFNPHRAVR